MATVTVRGLKELEAKLIQLGQVAGQKVMRQALFAATKPIMEQARTNAPRQSGALRVAMSRAYKASASSEGGGRFVVAVGPKAKNRAAVGLYNLVHKRGRPIRGIYYGHMIEFGHLTRPPGSGVSHSAIITKRGTLRIRARKQYDRTAQRPVPARPFLVPALQSRADEATRLLAARLKIEIDKRLE